MEISNRYPAPGERVTATVRLRNNGNISIGSFYIRSGLEGVTDILVSALSANSNISRTFNYTVPNDASAGDRIPFGVSLVFADGSSVPNIVLHPAPIAVVGGSYEADGAPVTTPPPVVPGPSPVTAPPPVVPGPSPTTTPESGGASPAQPSAQLAGAAEWARGELELAHDAGLLIEEMFGKWPQATSRLLAADAIVRLIEVSTGKTIDAIAVEKGFDMSDRFADTNSKAATFLKAAGISNGVDSINFGYAGSFTRVQLVTMLGRIAENVFGMDLSSYPIGSATFKDIPANMSWSERYVGWAAAVGITQGDGVANKFNPSANLTNQQTGLFIYRAFEKAFIK